PEVPKEEVNPDIPRIAIVGRPNVGKSSMVNALLGEDRMIASNIPGTTRDAVDSLVTYSRKKYVIIDTAGIRSRGKVSQGVEKYSVMRAMRAIERCDVAVLLVDATEGGTEQDSKVAGLIHEAGKGMIIAVNKWDLVENKETMTAKKYEQQVRFQLKFADYAEVVFVSAATKQRIAKILPLAAEIVATRRKKVSTATLNDTLQRAIIAHRPPSMGNKPVKINYITQVGTEPPAFSLFCNHPDGIHFSYKRYLENQLREAFGFEGTPIKMFFRRK
ncbi:MAG: ribosome biogenesis GTPase Der, partial [Nitrospirota bacterium]|nr:ribosome biogenesis GTPase Der [Nitrospirota bacterium]